MSLGIFDGRAALGKPPSPYWPEDRVKQLQSLLNAELSRWSCNVTLKVDGLIGPMTCAALKYARSAATSMGQPLSGTLQKLLEANDADFASACSQVEQRTLSCAVPKPAPPPAPTATAPSSGDILVMQSLLNDEVLKKNGLTNVPESGKLDALTCGAASAVYADAKAGRLAVSQELMRLVSLSTMPTACEPFKPWTTPTKVAAPAPAPAPKPAPAPAPTAPSYEQCWIDYGAKSAAVTELQKLINVRLKAKGYLPIKVTGTYDAATCGAVTALKDAYDSWATKSCPAGPVVALRCPKTVAPKKVSAPKPPAAKAAPPPTPAPAPTKPKLNVATAGLLAAAVVGAGWYAKKRGLLG